MTDAQPVRWGVLSTANIARSAFLPALRASGTGVAYAVAGRTWDRTQAFADAQGIDRAIEGYENLLSDEQVDAVYIALPNSLHAEWTIAALQAGKAVVCEKPLCVSVEETEAVLRVARETGQLLWEAFVFPFQPQSRRVQDVIESGEIGELREVESNFHFRLRSRANIRLDPDLGGGALNDVGCYCVRLADLLLDATANEAAALAKWADEGVDEEMEGVLSYPTDRRLVFSCGMSRPVSGQDTFSRLLGSSGEIRLSNPFHPDATDTVEIRTPERTVIERHATEEPSFTPALRHINAAIRGGEQPMHLAVDESLSTAVGLDITRRSARSRTGVGA